MANRYTLLIVGIAAVVTTTPPTVSDAKGKGRAAAELSPAYSACMVKSGGITVEMHNCAAAETSRQDDLLNAAYRRLIAKLPTEQKEALRKAQRAWVAFRDSECNLAGSFEEGTMGPIVIDDCYSQLTSMRVNDLRLYQSQADAL